MPIPQTPEIKDLHEKLEQAAAKYNQAFREHAMAWDAYKTAVEAAGFCPVCKLELKDCLCPRRGAY